jgi:arginase
MDLGAGRRGVDMGPSALRVAELGSRLRDLGYVVEDFGDVRVKHPEQQEHGDSKLKYKGPILETCRELAIASSSRSRTIAFRSSSAGTTRSRSARPRASVPTSGSRTGRWASSGSTPTAT